MKPKFLFVVSLACILMVAPGYAKQRRSAGKRAVKQEKPEAQPAPTPPPTLAEMPPSSPQVSFQDGQLTISAQNSTLGDILKAVRAQTSATIDLPGNASERVVGHFGPGPARDVLASLLNGSHFNYLLLGSPTDANALDRVILMAKSAGGAQSSPQPPNEQANAYNQNVYNNRVIATPMAAPGANTTVVEGQDATDDTADDSADSTDDAQADDQTDQTDQTDDQQAGEDQQQQQPDAQPNVKTPEQLLQELQQRQQQIQQRLPPGAPGFPTPGQPGMPPGPPHN